MIIFFLWCWVSYRTFITQDFLCMTYNRIILIPRHIVIMVTNLTFVINKVIRPTLFIAMLVPRWKVSLEHFMVEQSASKDAVTLKEELLLSSSHVGVQVSEKCSGRLTQVNKAQGYLWWKENRVKENTRGNSRL